MVAGVASRIFLASLIRELYHVRIDTNQTDIKRLMTKLSSRKSFRAEDSDLARSGIGSKRVSEVPSIPEDTEVADMFSETSKNNVANRERSKTLKPTMHQPTTLVTDKELLPPESENGFS